MGDSGSRTSHYISVPAFTNQLSSFFKKNVMKNKGSFLRKWCHLKKDFETAAVQRFSELQFLFYII